MEEVTEEQQVEFQALCRKLELALDGETLDSALQALTAVTARLCASAKTPTALCVTIIEDLLANFRDDLEALPGAAPIQDKAVS